ncbi:hypothetical protein, partial [Kaarinaea lacus]
MISPATVLADVENWYIYWALGFASHDYPSEIDNYIDSAESIPGVERSEFAIDMIGFYWPVVNNNTMAGFAISGSGDLLKDKYDDYIQYNQYLFGASGMRFFGKEIGDGFFVRGDVGLASLRTISNFQADESSDPGIGYLVGVGFGIAVSYDRRIMISVDFANNMIEGDNYKTTSFKIGG